jgi:hypothetical protein
VNANKTKIILFKKGGRLKKSKRWTLLGLQTETVSKISYIGMTSDSKENQSHTFKGLCSQTIMHWLLTCFWAQTHCTFLGTPENICWVENVAWGWYLRNLCGVEANRAHGRFCKKILAVPRCTANSAAELEVWTGNNRSKTVGWTVKYGLTASYGQSG